MRFKLTLGMIVIALLSLVPAVSAQKDDVDLPNTHTFEDGATVQYPADWEVDATIGETFDQFTSDDSLVGFYLATGYDFYGIPEGDIAAYLEAFFNDVMSGDGLTAAADEIVVTTLDNRAAALYDYIDSYGDEAMMVVIEFSDGTVAAINAWTWGGELTERNEVIAMAATYNKGDGTTTPPATSGGDKTEREGNTTASENAIEVPDVDLVNTHTLDDGASIGYPANFEVDATIGETFDQFTSDDSLFGVYLATDYDFYSLEAGDIGGYLEAFFNDVMSGDGLTAAADEIIVGTLNNRPAALYDYIDSYGDEAMMVVIEFSDGTAAGINAWTWGGELTERDVAIAMAASYDVEGGSVAAPVQPNVSTSGEFTFEVSGLTVDLPDGWEVSINEENGFVTLRSSESTYFPGWYYASDLEELGITQDDLADVLADYFFPINDTLTFDATAVELQDVDGRTVAYYEFVDSTSDGTEFTKANLAVALDNGMVFVAEIFPQRGFDITELDDAYAILLSAR